MKRRDFLQAAVVGAAAAGLAGLARAAIAPAAERARLAGLLQRMAEPVLSNMAKGELQQGFALEVSPTWDGRDKRVACLECFGRLAAGIAPWLALPEDDTAEGRVRKRLRQQALQSYTNAVDPANPANPDYLLWKGQGQALVDSAYFTNALMRAPTALWEPLDAVTRQRIVHEIEGLRRVNPPYTNWLLCAAMNEAWLMSVGEEVDPMRLNPAIRKINEWYVGGGWIKDGESFHFDYVLVRHKGRYWNGKPAELLAQAVKRMARHAEYLERFISPQGTFPPDRPFAHLPHRRLPAAGHAGLAQAAAEKPAGRAGARRPARGPQGGLERSR